LGDKEVKLAALRLSRAALKHAQGDALRICVFTKMVRALEFVSYSIHEGRRFLFVKQALAFEKGDVQVRPSASLPFSPLAASSGASSLVRE
jgi:hypothetical protein